MNPATPPHRDDLQNSSAVGGSPEAICSEITQISGELSRLAGDSEAEGHSGSDPGALRRIAERLERAAARVSEWEAGAAGRVVSLEQINKGLSTANARAAELIVEIEQKNGRIDALNKKLATVNATAAELVAELEFQRSELEKANTALRLANEEKAHLLGVIAHDLRSGIGAVSSLADLLLEDESGDEAQRKEFLGLIQSQTRQLLELLSSLLGMSRLEQGRLDIHPHGEDLRNLVREAVHFHRHFAAIKQQELVERLPAGPVIAFYDPTYIRQVLDNLLSNAIKYSFIGGRIDVECVAEPPVAVVSVFDSGPGLSPEDFPKIFSAFQKLSAKPTGGEESHGLGLTIAKKVIEAHGGALTVENQTGKKGAVFRFTLPMFVPGQRA